MITTALAPADITVTAPAPATVTAAATPVAPAGIVVASARPAFTVTVTTSSTGQQVQVQYATDPAFAAGPVSVFADAPAGLDDAQVTAATVAGLADGIWYWRARITDTWGAGPWSAVVQFAVNAAEGSALAAGSFTVNAGAPPAAHLWYIDPGSGTDSGQPLYLIGAGFGSAPLVQLGALTCPVSAVETITGTGGVIDAAAGVCQTWHQRITASIPAVDPDHVGDAVTVQGG